MRAAKVLFSLSITLTMILADFMKECPEINSKEAKQMLGDNTRLIADKVNNERYTELDDFLGEGSFGRVFKHVMSRKMLAIKAIKSQGMTNWDKNNLKRELKLWPDLSKKIPNSVPNLVGCAYDPNFTYIIQELLYKDLESEEFQHHLAVLNLEGRVRLMISISDALSELHELLFIHNDLKPANLMSTNSKFERVKLIDFGFVTPESAKFSGGTPFYNAPEKINSRLVTADPSIDIWAMGMTFYEILANFKHKNVFLRNTCYKFKKFTMECHSLFWDKFKKQMQTLYHANIDEDFSGDLEDAQNVFEVVLSTLNYEPDMRPSAGDVSEALEEFLDEIKSTTVKAKRGKKRNSASALESDDEEKKEKKRRRELTKGQYRVLSSQHMAERPADYINVNNMVLRPRRKQVDHGFDLI